MCMCSECDSASHPLKRSRISFLNCVLYQFNIVESTQISRREQYMYRAPQTYHDRKGDVLRLENMSSKLRLHHFLFYIMQIYLFSALIYKIWLIVFLTSQCTTSPLTKPGFEAPMCLGWANCSRLVTSAYLR